MGVGDLILFSRNENNNDNNCTVDNLKNIESLDPPKVLNHIGQKNSNMFVIAFH